MKHLGVGYQDVLSMPVYERRMYINFLKEEAEQEQAYLDNIKQKYSSKNKGKRTTHLSGDDAKRFAMQNQ